MKSKVYLRYVEYPRMRSSLEFFEGDIEKDRKDLIDNHCAFIVRYFELKEVKA